MCSESAEMSHLPVCCSAHMDLLFYTGHELLAPPSARCWSIPMTHGSSSSPQSPRVETDYCYPHKTLGLEMRNCNTSLRVTLGRLRPKEELGCIPGHCPGSWICSLTPPQPPYVLSCSTSSPEITWLFQLRETGSRSTSPLLGSFTEQFHDHQQLVAGPRVLFAASYNLSIFCSMHQCPWDYLRLLACFLVGEKKSEFPRNIRLMDLLQFNTKRKG